MNIFRTILVLLPITVIANPTSGWQDSDGGGFFAILATLAIFIVPYVISRIFNLFKSEQNLNKKNGSQVDYDNSEQIVDKTENDKSSEDLYTNVYKKHAKELAKGMYIKEPNKPNRPAYQSTISGRDVIYILIIFGLCMLLFYQYSKYRQDSFSRTVQCFADEISEENYVYCNQFFENQKERIIREDSVEIILGCLDTQIAMCATEDITDNECIAIGMAYCDAKHPEYMKFFDEEYKKLRE